MKRMIICILVIMTLVLTACGQDARVDDVLVEEETSTADDVASSTDTSVMEMAAVDVSVLESTTDSSVAEEEEAETPVTETPVTETLKFVDVFGEEYETTIKSDVPKHSYNLDAFRKDGNVLMYEDDTYTSRYGIDVSRHQGRINWEKMKSQGVEFTFLRIGYRGYGEAGNINLDKRFYENITGAQSAGIDVGVYFFSQAINEEEALEEAKFVIDKLQGYELQLPVVYDPESILDDVARTDDVSGEQFTKNTIVFCDSIRENGYEPMIYSNMLWEAFEFDLSQLTDIPIWYADYEELPQTPYHFVFWQYTNEGRISGIDGSIDLDIQIIKK